MRSGWEIKRLGDVCDTGAGGTPLKSNKDFYQGGKIPWLMSGEVSQGEIFKASNFITEKGLRNSSAKLFPANSVLVAMYGATAGQVGILRFEASTNQAVCGIMPNKHFIPEFLFYCFLLKKEELILQAIGNAQPNISQEKIRNTLVPVPPLSEQKRIVEILDDTFATINKAKANVEKNLQNAKELFESYLQNVFANKGEDWEEKTLREVLQKTEMIDPTKFPHKEFIYIDVSSVNKENLEIENASVIKGKDAPSRARKLIKTNDIIFATVRPTLKRIAIISDEYNEQVCSTGYFVMRTTEVLNHKLIFYYLQTNSFFKHMEKLQRGASYPAVTDGDVRNQIIHFPKSIQTQNKLAGKLENLSSETKKLETIYQQKLNDLEELKKSILQKAFSGELTNKMVDA